MENICLSKKEVDNLTELFNENYLILKKIKEIEKDIYEENIRMLLKKIKNAHEKNILIIMKLIDEKERFI